MIVGPLTHELTTFSGQYHRLTAARCEPKPVQRLHPPICIGGSGEKRALRTAARFAHQSNSSAEAGRRCLSGSPMLEWLADA